MVWYASHDMYVVVGTSIQHECVRLSIPSCVLSSSQLLPAISLPSFVHHSLPPSSSLPPHNHTSHNNNPSNNNPSNPDHPFDPSELEAALQKTTLDSTKEVDTPLDTSGQTSPLQHPFGLQADMYGPEPPLRPRERLIAVEEVRGGDARRVGSL